MKFKSSLLALCALGALSTSCVDVQEALHIKKEKKKSNKVTNTRDANQIINNEGVELQVISETALKQAALNKSILSISNPEVMRILSNLPQGEPAESINKDNKEIKGQEESLLVGFPIGLIGEQNVFGGVITKVTDQESESLGTLKLTDLSPIHVRTLITRMSNGAPAMTLVGCFSQCTEDSEQQGLINLPIVGFNQETGMLVIDMAAIGKELDLISMLDPKGEYTQLKAISSDTVAVDFDMKTLIFDIKTKMIPVTAKPEDPAVKTTDFTVRWYMKLGSGFNPAFESLNATEGVGFFMTERSKNRKITRFSTTGNGTGAAPVKYYIKNVPAEFKPHFESAIKAWNVEFKDTIGKDLISYEFVDGADAEEFVTGDIRYNIIEWDLINKAGYGGLGPSIANQYTGETMSANVLVQGPTIVKLYTEWFGVSQKANDLIAQGRTQEANALIKNFEVSVSKEMEKRTQKTFKLKLGKHLEMNVHAQKEHLEDPIKKGHFEIVPEGMTYEKYMQGYMLEIVGHELGHNLGLRHNFKGNLGSYENNDEPGSVSRSIMEYLGRPFRYLNTIGPYDRMAIEYAYGKDHKLPDHTNWFCTDEDQGMDARSMQVKSPECSKADATSDPFSFLEGRLNRILDLILDRKSAAAPVWKVADVKTELNDAINGLVSYALSAEKTAETWTNFFGKNDRPENKSEVKAYVLKKIKKKICNPALQDIINAKESAEAQKLATDNLNELRKEIETKTTALGAFTAQDLNCAE